MCEVEPDTYDTKKLVLPHHLNKTIKEKCAEIRLRREREEGDGGHLGGGGGTNSSARPSVRALSSQVKERTLYVSHRLLSKPK